MDRELLFAQKLQTLQKEAKNNGNIVSEERVKELFEELELNEEQLNLVFDYLKKRHIGIGEPVADEDFLEQEEIDYLDIYMKELAELPTFTEGEKEGVTLSAMAGDTSAQNRLVEMFLPDVVEIAKLYAGQGVYLEDLIGEGNVALAMGVTMLGALEHASEAQGTLAKLIMDAMEEFIAESAEETKKDEKIVNRVNEVAAKADELYEELRRKVTIEELVQETGMSRKMITDAVRLSGRKIDSIDDSDITDVGTEE